MPFASVGRHFAYKLYSKSSTSRFTKDSCMVFVSLFFYVFPSLTQGGEKDSKAYQKLEGRLKLKVIRRFISLSVISF